MSLMAVLRTRGSVDSAMARTSPASGDRFPEVGRDPDGAGTSSRRRVYDLLRARVAVSRDGGSPEWRRGSGRSTLLRGADRERKKHARDPRDTTVRLPACIS